MSCPLGSAVRRPAREPPGRSVCATIRLHELAGPNADSGSNAPGDAESKSSGRCRPECLPESVPRRADAGTPGRRRGNAGSGRERARPRYDPLFSVTADASPDARTAARVSSAPDGRSPRPRRWPASRRPPLPPAARDGISLDVPVAIPTAVVRLALPVAGRDRVIAQRLLVLLGATGSRLR